MRSHRLFWKLFLISVGLHLTLAIGFLWIVVSSQRREINRQVEQRLETTAVMLRSQVRGPLARLLDDDADASSRQRAQERLQSMIDELAGEIGLRLTLVDADGLVLADSDRDFESMLNHANRPELIAASEFGRGVAMRPSPTLQTDMLYLAIPINTSVAPPAFVRVAVELETIQARIAVVSRSLWLLALVFAALATALTYAIVARVIRPLAELTQRAQAIAGGGDQSPVPIRSRDEVGLLAEAFNRMQAHLAARFRELRDNNEQMATVLASMDEGIIAVDADQKIVLANDASKIFFTFAGTDEVGRPLLESVRNRTLHDVVQQCLERGKAVQTELESTAKTRRTLSVRATCLPGKPAHGVVLVLHDITELRRLENLRRDFVANVSHELKTPLSSIKAYAETLRLGAIDDPEHSSLFVARIEEQAERLHQLILDMLQIARVEAGDEVFDITRVAIERVVRAGVRQHAKTAQRKEIEVIVARPEMATFALADEDGLNTILDNLLGNAIKYTPEGGRVTLRWWNEGDSVCLEVEDSGVGIAPAHHSRVFERFYRADKARSRELGGTGLGLSIVKHLCQAFGGSVSLRSRLGKGSCFRVRVPRA